MRRWLPKWAMTGMAIVGVALLVNGCEAQSWGAPPTAESTPRPRSQPRRPRFPRLPEPHLPSRRHHSTDSTSASVKPSPTRPGLVPT